MQEVPQVLRGRERSLGGRGWEAQTAFHECEGRYCGAAAKRAEQDAGQPWIAYAADGSAAAEEDVTIASTDSRLIASSYRALLEPILQRFISPEQHGFSEGTRYTRSASFLLAIRIYKCSKGASRNLLFRNTRGSGRMLSKHSWTKFPWFRQINFINVM